MDWPQMYHGKRAMWGMWYLSVFSRYCWIFYGRGSGKSVFFTSSENKSLGFCQVEGDAMLDGEPRPSQHTPPSHHCALRGIWYPQFLSLLKILPCQLCWLSSFLIVHLFLSSKIFLLLLFLFLWVCFIKTNKQKSKWKSKVYCHFCF